MKVGIKIGLKGWRENLTKSRARVCEIYFRLDKQEKFQTMFGFLKQKKIENGLHFWAVLKDGFFPNLASGNTKIRKESLKLAKQVIDIGAQHHSHYVNFHPGALIDFKINLDNGLVSSLFNQATPRKEARKILKENAFLLHQYAQQKGTFFLLETVPCRDPSIWWRQKGRLKPIDVKNIAVKDLIELSHQGIWIANDLAHTFCDQVSDDLNSLFQELKRKTKLLFSKTKLIHLATTAPPFNGTDSHHGLTNEDFAQGVRPTKKELISILKMFRDRDDVWLIPEPGKNHVLNHQIISQIVNSL